MGIGSSELNIPGGGTEGYHVLRVNKRIQFVLAFLKLEKRDS
jgi:hypothetical protein